MRCNEKAHLRSDLWEKKVPPVGLEPTKALKEQRIFLYRNNNYQLVISYIITQCPLWWKTLARDNFAICEWALSRVRTEKERTGCVAWRWPEQCDTRWSGDILPFSFTQDILLAVDIGSGFVLMIFFMWIY